MQSQGLSGTPIPGVPQEGKGLTHTNQGMGREGPRSVPESSGCPHRPQEGTGDPGHHHIPHQLCHSSSGVGVPQGASSQGTSSHPSLALPPQSRQVWEPEGPHGLTGTGGWRGQRPLPLGAAPCGSGTAFLCFPALQINGTSFKSTGFLWASKHSFKPQSVHLSLKRFLGTLVLPSLPWPCRAQGLGSGSIISPLNNTPGPSRSHEQALFSHGDTPTIESTQAGLAGS